MGKPKHVELLKQLRLQNAPEGTASTPAADEPTVGNQPRASTAVIPPKVPRKRASPRGESTREKKRSRKDTGKQAAEGVPTTTATTDPPTPINLPTGAEIPASAAPPPPAPFSIPNTHAAMSAGVLWSVGVTPELNDLLRPPLHMYSPTELSKEEEKSLAEGMLQAYRAVSLVHPYAALRAQYAAQSKTLEDTTQQLAGVSNLLEGVNKQKADLGSELNELRQQLAVTTGKLEESIREVSSTRADLAAAQDELIHFAALRLEHAALLQKRTSDDETWHKTLAQKEEELNAANSRLAQFGEAAKSSFASAIEQIQVLNPGVALNMEGLHIEAYVNAKGKLIPPGASDSDEEQPSQSASELPSHL